MQEVYESLSRSEFTEQFGERPYPFEIAFANASSHPERWKYKLQIETSGRLSGVFGTLPTISSVNECYELPSPMTEDETLSHIITEAREYADPTIEVNVRLDEGAHNDLHKLYEVGIDLGYRPQKTSISVHKSQLDGEEYCFYFDPTGNIVYFRNETDSRATQFPKELGLGYFVLVHESNIEQIVDESKRRLMQVLAAAPLTESFISVSAGLRLPAQTERMGFVVDSLALGRLTTAGYYIESLVMGPVCSITSTDWNHLYAENLEDLWVLSTDKTAVEEKEIEDIKAAIAIPRPTKEALYFQENELLYRSDNELHTPSRINKLYSKMMELLERTTT